MMCGTKTYHHQPQQKANRVVENFQKKLFSEATKSRFGITTHQKHFLREAELRFKGKFLLRRLFQSLFRVSLTISLFLSNGQLKPRSKWHSALKSNHAHPGHIAKIYKENHQTPTTTATVAPIINQVYPLGTRTTPITTTTENPQEILLTIPEPSTVQTVPIYVSSHRGLYGSPTSSAVHQPAPEPAPRHRTRIPIYLDIDPSTSESIIVITQATQQPKQRARIIRVPFLSRPEPLTLLVKKSTPSKRNLNAKQLDTVATANVTTLRTVQERHTRPKTNMTLASMAGIQLTDGIDHDSDHSTSMSGAMQPPTATVEEINVPVFIDEYLQQLHPSTLTAPTNYNTINNSSKQILNGNGEKENEKQNVQKEQQYQDTEDNLDSIDITTFENFDFDIDMIGHEDTEEYQEQLGLHQDLELSDQQLQGIVNSVPAWNDNIINNISNNNYNINCNMGSNSQQNLIEKMQTDKIDEHFKILPFSSDTFLSQEFSQQDLNFIELVGENAIDISDFNNDSISLVYNNNPLLSSDSSSTHLLDQPFDFDKLENTETETLSQNSYRMIEVFSCGHNSIDMSMNEDTKLEPADGCILYNEQQQLHQTIIPSDSQTINSYPQQPQQQQQQQLSPSTLNEFFDDYQPYTPQSPSQAMSTSPTPLSPKSRTIKRSSNRSKAKAQLNLNIPKTTDISYKLTSDQLQTPDVINTILACTKSDEPKRSFADIIHYLKSTPTASNANTTISSITADDFIITHCDSNVSSPKSFAEFYDEQPFTPQSHTSNTTNTTSAEYSPNSPALSVTSSTQDRKCSKKRGRPAKVHSDQPDEKTLAKLPENEQKRIKDRAKNNEASRLSRMRAKEKEDHEIKMEAELMEEHKQLSGQLEELERQEAHYKKLLMGH